MVVVNALPSYVPVFLTPTGLAPHTTYAFAVTAQKTSTSNASSPVAYGMPEATVDGETGVFTFTTMPATAAARPAGTYPLKVLLCLSEGRGPFLAPFSA